MALSDNIKAALLMSLAMASFVCNDALVKSVTVALNTGQILFVRGAISSVLIVILIRPMGIRFDFSMLFNRFLILRVAADTAATVTYILALNSLPLGNATSILQFMPLAVTLGAAIFLGEPVGWRRWSAIIIGFVGVMVIIRPGPEGFNSAAILALLCVAFAAARDLFTRKIPARIPSILVTAVTTIAITITGAVLIAPMGGWQPVSGTILLKLTVAAVLLLSGYQSIVSAMRTGEISFVAPFRYTGLLWAIALGFFAFGDIPDLYMLIGAAIVISSGLYTFYRENRRKAKALAQSSLPRAMH